MPRGSAIRAAIHALCAFVLWLMTFAATSAQPVVEAWVQRYSHPVDSVDGAGIVATDNAGNVIVAGSSNEGNTLNDFLVIKYSGAGVAMWTNRYNGPGNSNDYATALAVDGSGNVFVTGSSYDYATIKYSGSGVPLWTNRYHGPGNYADTANAMAVDGSGNVFVTGQSYGGFNSLDYGTVAYSGAGVALWTNRYNGPGNSHDYATAVAVDDSGNVFVTGRSSRSDFNSLDYATVAYSGAGVPLWTNRYNGPNDGDDYATAIAVDGNGNVFVTGSHSAASYSADYTTIKYSGAGVPLWTNLYNGPGNEGDQAYAIAVDGNGNVFVTGSSYAGGSSYYDYATVAYSGAGVPLWTNRYNGPGLSYDEVRGLAIDGSGNVFVNGSSGQDYVTVGYSGAGVPLWTNRYNGPENSQDGAGRVAVDGNGNVFVTGASLLRNNYDVVTVAYSGAGVPLWTARYNGQGNRSDIPYAMAVDNSGNVIVTGSSDRRPVGGGGISTDYATVFYTDAGVPLWTNRWGNGNDSAAAVAVDAIGNVFVTGQSYGGAFGFDYATLAYSASGELLWINRYNGSGNGYDSASAVAVDGDGNVFVTGKSVVSLGLGSWAYATVAYSTAGAPLWTNLFDGADSIGNRHASLAVDGSGNVFVAGSSYGVSSEDYATIAYSNAGVPLWTNRYNGPGNLKDWATAVAVDGSGNVFVTGRSFASEFNEDYATIAYSGAGVPLWTNRYNGPANDSDYAVALAVGGSGNVFVTGNSQGGANSIDYATIAYSAAGVPLWTNRYNGPVNGYDYASAVAVDPNGNVFVTGWSSSGSSDDYVTIAYSGAGAPLWTNRYNGPANGEDQPRTKSCLAIGPDGAVYVTGASDGDYSTGVTSYDYATIKYVRSTPSPRLQHQVIGNQLVLSWTNAAFRLQSASNVQGDYTDVPGATSPHSTSFLGTQRFFRLKAD